MRVTGLFGRSLRPGYSGGHRDDQRDHYEYEEEWLLVPDGTIVVRVPDGEQLLECGDLVCFPAGTAAGYVVRGRDRSSADAATEETSVID